jgi:hypothetical protein
MTVIRSTFLFRGLFTFRPLATIAKGTCGAKDGRAMEEFFLGVQVEDNEMVMRQIELRVRESCKGTQQRFDENCIDCFGPESLQSADVGR